MGDTHLKGQLGEDRAADYLCRLGFTILERNWRHRHKEIDIIAMDPAGNLRIIEVKSRHYNPLAEPEDAVNREKQKNLISAANSYVRIKCIYTEVFFDIVTVIEKNDGSCQMDYIPSAFYPIAG